MRRRAFIATAGAAAAAWPSRAHGQHVPIVGFLSSRAPTESAEVVAAFRQGLRQLGFIEGQNVLLAFRWAEGRYDQLPAMAADLAAAQVAIIFAAGGAVSAFAARNATTSIPIVFIIGDDPVQIGLTTSVNRPGGNITGVTLVTAALAAKRIELLCELAPNARTIGLLVNSSNVTSPAHIEDAKGGAQALGRQLAVESAATGAEIEPSIAALKQAGAAAIVVQNDPFFDSQRELFVAAAARQAIPAIYHVREFPASGGLMSYGSSLADAYRLAGAYAGRILGGARPGDLPIEQATKFEFVMNLRTAQALGLAVPPGLLARADEVIE
jgi:putative tryptophan/tyrosine transport system substrate-binding protein